MKSRQYLAQRDTLTVSKKIAVMKLERTVPTTTQRQHDAPPRMHLLERLLVAMKVVKTERRSKKITTREYCSRASALRPSSWPSRRRRASS
jgi:hypothetical protein